MFKKNLTQYYGLHTKYYQEVSDVKLNPSTLNVYNCESKPREY